MSRRKLRAAALFLIGAGLLLWCRPAHSKDVPWLPITQEELALKDNPLSPGSSAMILYREMITSDPQSSETHYWRIKVLTEAGRKWANVEIPYPQGRVWITGVQARTVHADGTIANLTGQGFDKLVVKTRRVSYLARTFTLPDVQVGSILEYRYTLHWDFYLLYSTKWLVEHELFTRKAHFSLLPSLGSGYNIRWLSMLPPSYGAPHQGKDGTVQLDVQNVPGIAKESYMPPEDEVTARVLFYYTTHALETPDQFWKRIGKELYEDSEDFIGRHKGVQEEAAAMYGAADPPEARLRKLYARVQQMRNLSYERSKTEAEEKRENLKENKTAADVLKHGYGSRRELNRLFAALARAAGSDAAVVRIAERDDNFFHLGLLDASQLTGEVVVVRNGAQDLYLDPSTPRCPFGLLSWEKTGVQGIKLNKDGGVFVVTPSPVAADALEQHRATLRLDEDGALTGTLQITYNGQDALVHRLEAMDTDEAGRRKAIEDEIKALLPSTAEVKLGQIAGLETSDGPVTAEATVEIPGFGTSAGRRLLLPLSLLQFSSRHPFSFAQRTNPVYFHYPFEERDEVDLELPAGYQVESLPAARNVAAAFGDYEISRDQQANHVRSHRHLLIGGVIFKPVYYADLRGFYDKVAAGDGEQVVVQHGQAASK